MPILGKSDKSAIRRTAADDAETYLYETADSHRLDEQQILKRIELLQLVQRQKSIQIKALQKLLQGRKARAK